MQCMRMQMFFAIARSGRAGTAQAAAARPLRRWARERISYVEQRVQSRTP
ncbi:hypothetical protein [Effusibacillus dendaii]|nr:hypothetical protein [Effusibacillus dendaii]